MNEENNLMKQKSKPQKDLEVMYGIPKSYSIKLTYCEKNDKLKKTRIP